MPHPTPTAGEACMLVDTSPAVAGGDAVKAALGAIEFIVDEWNENGNCGSDAAMYRIADVFASLARTQGA